MQHGGQWRTFVTGHIGVPAVAVGDFRVGIGVNDEDLGMAMQMGCSRMLMQFAKLAGERDVLIRGQARLVAEEQHLMFREQYSQLSVFVGGSSGEISAENFGADHRCARLND